MLHLKLAWKTYTDLNVEIPTETETAKMTIKAETHHRIRCKE